MSRSEDLDAPLLKVSRPVSACSRCRSAKIKCDGRLPACSNCRRLGRTDECSTANDQSAKGKERSYVAALESRLEKLERRLNQARGRQASVTMRDAQLSGAVNGSGIGSRQLAPIRSSTARAAQQKEALNVDDLVSDFGFLYVPFVWWSSFIADTDVCQCHQCHSERFLWLHFGNVVRAAGAHQCSC